MEELLQRYFEWLCRIVMPGAAGDKYSVLLEFLHSMLFHKCVVAMDKNRVSDGIDLRYLFAKELFNGNANVGWEIDQNMPDECTVLELMAALSIRIETIIHDDDEGDRTAYWFMDMLKSLNLDRMRNQSFDEHTARIIISRFIDRKYAEDGSGGLFTVPGSRCDLSKIEIWYQMMAYLNQIRPTN